MILPSIHPQIYFLNEQLLLIFIATLCNYWIIILLFIVFVSFVFLSLPYNTKRIETTVVVIQHFVNKTELNY